MSARTDPVASPPAGGGSPGTASRPPLVSVIVRSMGRPELAVALASIAAQDYPSIEAIVVDASGGTHPPLPAIDWRPGHGVRKVGGERRLPRAQAAQAGLLAARGEWLCFLDDDDTYDSHFVSAMVQAAAPHPDALLVYGPSRYLDAQGRLARLLGVGFNRAIMHYGPLFHWSSAIIRREVVDLGCHFDPALDVCEDRDFLAQIAEHGDFVFVPVVGFNYHAHLGTSGTADANRDVANTVRYDSLLRAKDAGPGAYHTWRATRLCARAVEAYHAGDRDRSRRAFEAVLREYPDDPNALHGLARVALDEGALEDAERLVDRAIDINRTAMEFRATRAAIRERRGLPPDPPRAPAAAPAAASAPAVSRLGPCPCGSGKRYKQCCGRAPAEASSSEADRGVLQAGAWFARGEAARAKALLDTLSPADVASADLARAAGEACLELGDCKRVYAFLDRSSRIAPSPRTGALLYRCCDTLWLDRARASAHAMALRLRDRIQAGAGVSAPARHGPIHVVGTLDTLGGSENQAIALYRLLAPLAPVRLWSTAPPRGLPYAGVPVEVIDPARGTFPDGGTLVLAGHYFDCGHWWPAAAFDRVVIWVSLDLPRELVQRMADIGETRRAARIDFTFCSQRSRDLFGLPGEVEYPLIDLDRFAPARRPRRDGRLVVGRHSRDDRLKHHPNDPALYRRLVARGHRLHLLGATCLQGAFQGDAEAAGIELEPAGREDPRAFLGGLDCFLYRKHPSFFETCGAVVLEAMAMELPVVLFREGVGAAELIEHGRDGFLVDSEEEALACIERLAADAGLRADIGAAARRKVGSVMAAQRSAARARYLGSA